MLGSRNMYLRCSVLVQRCLQFDQTKLAQGGTSHKMSDYTGHVQGKYMQKFLNRKGAKKRKWYEPHLAASIDSLGRPKMKVGGQKAVVTETQRTRAKQLSHVLYDRITHIINTGELSQEIFNKQVFITEVKMHANFGGINVYWEADRLDSADVDKLLQSHTGKLRSLLISYHVLGKIPPIQFVKSKGKNYLGDIDTLLEQADYGEDYEPLDSVVRFRTGQESHQRRYSNLSDVESNNQERLNDIESQHESFYNNDAEGTYRMQLYEVEGQRSTGDIDTEMTGETNPHSPSEIIPNLPQSLDLKELHFRDNVYGLPVNNLMKKIQAKKNKVKVSGDDNGFNFNALSEEEKSKKLSSIVKTSKADMDTHRKSTKVKQRLLERDPEDYTM